MLIRVKSSEREGGRERQTDRQAGRQTDRQTHLADARHVLHAEVSDARVARHGRRVVRPVVVLRQDLHLQSTESPIKDNVPNAIHSTTRNVPQVCPALSKYAKIEKSLCPKFSQNHISICLTLHALFKIGLNQRIFTSYYLFTPSRTHMYIPSETMFPLQCIHCKAHKSPSWFHPKHRIVFELK